LSVSLFDGFLTTPTMTAVFDEGAGIEQHRRIA
jgi:hypothetical protein